MGKSVLILVSAFFILTIWSCDNDVELFGDIDETAVVYGLLSSSDTAQYIRLERSFADPNTSAVVLAQDESQVYFSDAAVALIDQTNSQRFELTRVNATNEGFVRNPGDFLVEPNYLYKIRSSDINLEPGTAYVLEVLKGENMVATSSTLVLENSKWRAPSVSGGVARIGFENGDETTLRWARVENASSYAISFDIIVRENDIVNSTQEIFALRWNATNLVGDKGGTNSSQDLDLPGESFFNFIQSSFDPNPNVTRQILKMDIRVTSFGQEIGQYLDVINANAGITSAQEVPTFTNIEGGLGLFSSTNETELEDLSLSSRTLDSLYEGSITGDLQFTP